MHGYMMPAAKGQRLSSFVRSEFASAGAQRSASIARTSPQKSTPSGAFTSQDPHIPASYTITHFSLYTWLIWLASSCRIGLLVGGRDSHKKGSELVVTVLSFPVAHSWVFGAPGADRLCSSLTNSPQYSLLSLECDQSLRY
jgi:hypothetical protein